jgi:hypothetical protein
VGNVDGMINSVAPYLPIVVVVIVGFILLGKIRKRFGK